MTTYRPSTPTAAWAACGPRAWRRPSTRATRLSGFVTLAMLCLGEMAHAGPPYLTDDPEPVEQGHGEVYLFSMGTRGKDGSTGLLPAIEANYGAAKDLQLHVIVPEFDAHLPHQARQSGLGDVELGAKYRFVDEDEEGWRPMVGIFPLAEVPSHASTLSSSQTRSYLPLWVQKSWGPWTTYGGGGYWFNPGATNLNYWFEGWLLQRKLSDSLALGAEVFHQSATAVGLKATSGVNVGATWDLSDHHHLLASAGKGLWDGSGSNLFSYYAGYQYTY